MKHNVMNLYRRISIVVISSCAITILRFGIVYGQATEEHLDSLIWRVEKYGVLFEARKVNKATVPYEWVYYELTVTNLGESMVEIPPLMFNYRGDLDYQLKDADGLPICQMTLTSVGGIDYLKALNPGESMSDFINVRNIFCWPLDAARPMLPPGSYSITLTLRVNIASGAAKERKGITIGPMPFDIVEAAGDDAVALKIYEQAFKVYKESPDRAKEYFQKILTEFSHTPFDMLVIHTLSHARKGKGTLLSSEEILDLWKKLLLRHPDNPYNVTSNIRHLAENIPRTEFVQLYRAIRDQKGAQISVRYMAREYPWVLEGKVK